MAKLFRSSPAEDKLFYQDSPASYPALALRQTNPPSTFFLLMSTAAIMRCVSQSRLRTFLFWLMFGLRLHLVTGCFSYGPLLALLYKHRHLSKHQPAL